MLGGGTFVTQNKTLPGAYINFVSASRINSNLADRGIAAIALPLSWGVDDAIFTVTSADFRKNCEKIFGFSYSSEAAKGLRDLFKNIQKLYCYKLMKNGNYATNSIARAKYKGSAGANLSTEILAGTTSGTFDVNIYLNNAIVFSETVSSIEQLLADDNGWVVWTIESIAETEKTALAGTDLDGEAVTVTEHTAFLNAVESYSFNALACLSSEDEIKALYVAAVKDARENYGLKYQLVVYNNNANYEGVVNVKNNADLVYWVTGIIAGCPINESNTNRVYDGEFEVEGTYSKVELENAIVAGEFVLHKVGDDIRVLEDINSLTTITENKGEDFKSNQTIRVVDQIATDIANLFNTKYLGKIPNDAAGRISFWNDIVKHHQSLVNLRAITDFVSEDVVVEAGDDKKSIVVSDKVTVINAISHLYMTVVVQ